MVIRIRMLQNWNEFIKENNVARMAELVDAPDSKSGSREE